MILIVDDSIVVRQVLSLTLKGAGYPIIEAVNGVDALEKLKNHSVKMIITDLNMPEMNGIEFIRELRGSDAHKFIPVVMLSTVSEEAKKEEGRLAGASGWIYKPVTAKQLLDTVRKFI